MSVLADAPATAPPREIDTDATVLLLCAELCSLTLLAEDHAKRNLVACALFGDGAAAAVLCSDEFAAKHNIDNPVYIAAQTMTTDYSSSFDDKSMMKMVGYDMAVNAAKQAYEKASIGPEDVDVVELHDCFTANELLTYEALGLCPEGKGGEFVDSGAQTYGGKVVVNPSGGLIVVRFLVGTDPDQAAVRVHTKIQSAVDSMPPGAMPPVDCAVKVIAFPTWASAVVSGFSASGSRISQSKLAWFRPPLPSSTVTA